MFAKHFCEKTQQTTTLIVCWHSPCVEQEERFTRQVGEGSHHYHSTDLCKLGKMRETRSQAPEGWAFWGRLRSRRWFDMGECAYECIYGSPGCSRREGLREITFLTLTKSTHAEQPGPQYGPSLDSFSSTEKKQTYTLVYRLGKEHRTYCTGS